jgi:hypothetical protein
VSVEGDVECAGAFAGKPAPTKIDACFKFSNLRKTWGAGLPAKKLMQLQNKHLVYFALSD